MQLANVSDEQKLFLEPLKHSSDNVKLKYLLQLVGDILSQAGAEGLAQGIVVEVITGLVINVKYNTGEHAWLNNEQERLFNSVLDKMIKKILQLK